MDSKFLSFNETFKAMKTFSPEFLDQLQWVWTITIMKLLNNLLMFLKKTKSITDQKKTIYEY